MKTNQKSNPFLAAKLFSLGIFSCLCNSPLVAQAATPDTKASLQQAAAAPEVVKELEEPDGASFQWTEDGGWRLFGIGSATYDFNDPSDISDATQAAILEAKAALARYMKEKLKTDIVRNKASEKKRTQVTGTGKNVTKEEVETILDTITNSADALLRGVITLETNKIPNGDKGGTVRVKVVVSSKSQAMAEKVSREIGAGGPPSGEGSTGTGSSPADSNKKETRRSKSDY